MAESLQITGLGDVLGRLETVKRAVANRIIRAAVTAASQPVLQTARQYVPVDQGWLKKSLTKVIRTYRTSGTTVGIVGPQTKLKFDKKTLAKVLTAFGNRLAKGATIADPAKYAHLVEFGTRRSKAEPFMRPAFDANKSLAAGIMEGAILAGIEKAAAKGS